MKPDLEAEAEVGVPVLWLRENDPWREAALGTAHATALAASQLVRIMPGARPGLWLVRDNGLVGAARVGPAGDAVEVRIAPKTRVDRLLFLLDTRPIRALGGPSMSTRGSATNCCRRSRMPSRGPPNGRCREVCSSATATPKRD